MKDRLCMIHGMLHQLIDEEDDLPEKFPSMWEGLAGQGLVRDHEIPDTLTMPQAKAIVLEYVQRTYKAAGY